MICPQEIMEYVRVGVTQRSQPKDIKPEMREHILRNGVNMQGQ